MGRDALERPGRGADLVEADQAAVGHRDRPTIALAVDAVGRPRQRFEPLGGDRSAASDAGSVCPRVDPRERVVDLSQRPLGTLPQGEVALLLEDLGRCGRLGAIGHLARRGDGLAELLEQAVAFGLDGSAPATTIVSSIADDRSGPGVPGAEAGILPWSISPTFLEESTMAIAIDPVCGMEVDTSTSDLSLEYEGTTYWFCGRGCLLEFRDDPEKYLSAGSRTLDVTFRSPSTAR